MQGSEVGEPFGTGGLGVRPAASGAPSTGQGTPASVAGIGYSAPPVRGTPVQPSIVLGPPAVVGTLSAEIVRRVVRRNFATLRQCADAGHARQPSLAGRIVVRFIITTRGEVTASSLAMTDLPLPAGRTVVECLVGATRTWAFPAPTSGIASVSLPFTLNPAP